jgi:drug/metabolite transporter (DMT)-like permease
VSDRRRPNAAAERAGLVFAGLCAALGALAPGFAKLTTNALDGLSAAAVTTAFGALAGVVLVAWRGELGRLADRRTAPRLAAMGALGTGGAFFLFFQGAQRTSAIETALCLQVEPAYSLLLARLALGHPITGRRVATVAVILVGIALALEPRGLSGALGVAFLLATPLCWQLSHLIALRGMPAVDPRVFATARYVYGGGLLAALFALRAATGGGPSVAEVSAQLPVLAFQGLVLSFVGTLLWYETIARLDLARATAIVVPSVPVLSLGASFLLLGEVASARQALGLALAVAGVLAFVTAPDARAVSGEELHPPTGAETAPTDAEVRGA